MYGLTAKALQTARRVMIHDIGRGGVIVVFRQYLDKHVLWALINTREFILNH